MQYNLIKLEDLWYPSQIQNIRYNEFEDEVLIVSVSIKILSSI